jgi:hypothetical protein
MTLQVEFWTVVGFLITFMSFVGGMAKWLFSKAEERQAARFASLEQSLQQSASNWGELEKEFMRFKADLPLNYVRREDYIRGPDGHRGQAGRTLQQTGSGTAVPSYRRSPWLISPACAGNPCAGVCWLL